MDKYTELEKQAQKFLDETDTMQFSTVELLTMFYEHQKQLTLTDVSQQRELLIDGFNWYRQTSLNVDGYPSEDLADECIKGNL